MLMSLGILLLVGGCFSGEPELGTTLTGAPIQVIGHAGSGFTSVDNYLPINSEISIKQAVDILGGDGVEVDVQLSADSVLMLYHDARLDNQTNCQGCINELSAAELRQCRYRSNFASNFTQREYLWTLEALMADFAQRPQPPWILIDVAFPGDCDFDFNREEYFRSLARQLSRLIDRYEARDWVRIEIDNPTFLDYIQAWDPTLTLAWLGPITTDRITMAVEKGWWGMVAKNEETEKSEVEEAHRQGLSVILYNIRVRKGTLEAVAKGADFIETDNIPLLHSVLE